MSELKLNGIPIGKLKVSELKNELDARGLGKTGKKDELVVRLSNYIEEHGSEVKSSDDEEVCAEKGGEEISEEAAASEGKKEREKEEYDKRKLAEKVEKEIQEEIQKLADEKKEKQRQEDEEKAKEKQRKSDEEKVRKEKKKQAEDEEAAKEKQRMEAKKEKKRREQEDLEAELKRKRKEERKNEEDKRAEEKKIKEQTRLKEEKLKEERFKKEEQRRKEEQKEREEKKLRDEKRQKDRQRRFEEEQKAEDERKVKVLAERKAKKEESDNRSNGKTNVNEEDSSKKADPEEEALDFEPEAPADDTLVMEVDQHDLVEEDKEAMVRAEPGDITSLRKLGGNKTSASSGERKRGWGAGRGRLGSSDHVAISSDTLKDLVPDPKPFLSTEADVGSPAEELDEDVAGPKPPKTANEPPKKRKKTEEDLNETEVLLITNLTRPFTVNQLKEMLKRTGTIVDFWIDRIKSKCCVEFSSSDQASETRMALNGVMWPQGNPKTLRVAFSSKEEMKKLQEAVADGALTKLGSENDGRSGVRDWDRNKLDQEKERDRERARSNREFRERGKSEEKPVLATKSLEELFNKTTAGPAIYWRPLSEEEIDIKIKERQQKIAEARTQKEMMESTEAVERTKRMGDALGVGADRSC